MRYEAAAVAPPKYAPRAWLDVVRILGAFGSLTFAFWAATYFAVERGYFLLCLAGGLVVFAGFMIALGRDIAQRWIAFGLALGLAPASRRAFFDFGTDRPALHGTVGHHPIRLRLLETRIGKRQDAWLQAEVDLLAEAHPAMERRARNMGAIVRDGRLIMRDRFLGFDAAHTRAFLATVGATADALARDG